MADEPIEPSNWLPGNARHNPSEAPDLYQQARRILQAEGTPEPSDYEIRAVVRRLKYGGGPAERSPSPLPARALGWARRHPWIAGLGALVIFGWLSSFSERDAPVATASSAPSAAAHVAPEAPMPRYDPGDEDSLLAVARALPASDVDGNVQVWADLLSIDSTNALYARKTTQYRERQRIALEQARAAAVRAEAAAALRGPRPEASGWDGSYREVKRYLKAVARDPDSVEIDGCTEVRVDERRNAWVVGCNWRGRNGFGGMNREANWFLIQAGQVVEMKAASAYDF
jgi:hypothetical protein